MAENNTDLALERKDKQVVSSTESEKSWIEEKKRNRTRKN